MDLDHNLLFLHMWGHFWECYIEHKREYWNTHKILVGKPHYRHRRRPIRSGFGNISTDLLQGTTASFYGEGDKKCVPITRNLQKSWNVRDACRSWSKRSNLIRLSIPFSIKLFNRLSLSFRILVSLTHECPVKKTELTAGGFVALTTRHPVSAKSWH
jgi:hypothetical protein